MTDSLQDVFNTFGDKMCLCPFFGGFYQTNEVVDESIVKHPNTIRPCSLIVSPPGSWDIKTDSIKDTRNNEKWREIRRLFIEGKFLDIPDCRVCTLTEEVGGSSPRLGASQYFAENLDIDFTSAIRACIDNDFCVDDLVVMDYYPSNYCNYACIMCAGGASSKRYTFEVKNGNGGRKIVVNEPDSDFYDALKTVRILNFTGGETLLQKQVHKLIDYLIDSNLASNIIISLLTNASSYPDTLIEKFKKFKRVIYTVSVDGVGPVIEYQRRGAHWDVVERNCLKIMHNPDLSGTINYVVTAVNILSAMDFIDWLYNNNLHWFTISPVFRAEYLGITAMPDNLRIVAQQRLQQGLKKYQSMDCLPLVNAIKTLLSMFDNAKFNPNDLEKFINHIKKEDAASDLKLLNVVPEWAPWLQEQEI